MEIFACVVMSFVLVAYMFPALVAYAQDHKDKVAILVLNILLGWTFIGWVMSLVWALVKK